MKTTRNFFQGCFNETEIKARYRDLCRVHHPDCGGDTRTMQDVNAEYKDALRGEYRKTKSDEATESAIEADERAAEVLAQIITLPDIFIEIVGRWIWVTGMTFEVREQLKVAGLKWASKKRAWHWHAPEDSCRGGKKDLDEIRAKYGTRAVESRPFERLAA